MFRKLLAVVSLLLLFSLSALGQGADAVLTGTVTDPTGALVPKAKVIAQNIATSVAVHTESNDAGVYMFPALPPGVYRVSAEQSGFQKLLIDNVTLEVGGKITLNLPLTVGSTSLTVQVQSPQVDTQLGYLTSSVGSVITGKKILELPLQGRNAFDFIGLQAGVSGDNNQNFSGARSGALNVTLEGVNTQDNFFNGLSFTNTANTVTVDRIAEFRVVTSPADAELGRGSGQIILVGRSGGNQFHGSVFEENRNTALTSNTFFNNQRGAERDFLVRNQYGFRIGGPVFLPRFGEGGKPYSYDGRNRTFFHFHYEGLRQRQRNAVTSTVYTQLARQGLFRFYPGASNANANGARPTVDLNGNPVKPSTATGDLQTVSIYGRDPFRNTPDPTGNVARALAFAPLPNNFRVGDGLNFAGFTWQRPISTDFSQWDLRFDHNFNQNHRLSFSFSNQDYSYQNTIGAQPYPGVPAGQAKSDTNFAALTFTSTLSPKLINEFRAGINRPRVRTIAPFDVDPSFLGRTSTSDPYILHFYQVTPPFAEANYGGESTFRITPVYQFGDNVTYLKDRHAFKGGVEYRAISTANWDLYAAMPRALLWTGTVPFQNISTIPGIGNNAGAAQQMLAELSGNVGSSYQTSNAASAPTPHYVPGLSRYRHWKQPELSFFFKDDWKVSQSLTLNLGVRYDLITVPYEADGSGTNWVGGGTSIFGISGNSFDSLFRPGVTPGSLSTWEQIGPGTAKPDARLWKTDKNNFSPALGLSWSLPWLGKDKTVLRAGYSIGYERNPIFLVNSQIFGSSGLATTRVFQSPTTQQLANFTVPLVPTSQPLQPVPLTDRVSTTYAFDPNLLTPYYQNWNVSLQRALTKDMVLEIRYVGNKGTKLIRSLNVDETNIFENGILEAFRITQAGGTAPLFDKIFNGLGFPGFIAGQNGVTGSDIARTLYPASFANNNPGAVANSLTRDATFTGVNGGLLRRVGLPENFVLVNPQFSTAYFVSNYGDSIYHSLQVEVVKRFSAGWTFQGNYTWSKALGDNEGDEVGFRGFSRTLRDGGLDYRRLSFDRRHVGRLNGIWEFPFGKGKRFASGSGGLLNAVIGGWQIGGICQISSGAPLNLTAINAFNSQQAEGAGATGPGIATPVVVGSLSSALGAVQRTANGVLYFTGFTQVTDPSVANITTLNNIRGQSTMRAIADASGNIFLRNPVPGQFGTVQQNYLTGPGLFRLDMNILKGFRIAEGKTLTLRADAINMTNTPWFANPVTDINSLNFGRISDTVGGSNRVIVVGARFEF